jgi:hypothetical protein
MAARPDPRPVDLVPYERQTNLYMTPRGGSYDWQFEPDDLRARIAGGAAGTPTLIALLRRLYPQAKQDPPLKGGEVAGLLVNNRAIGDRTPTTMGASEHPLPNTGPYTPPNVVRLGGVGAATPRETARALRNPAGQMELWRLLFTGLYPFSGEPNEPAAGPIANSQAIGDRSPTTMTNPLPGYRSPLQMTNTPLVDQLRTLITQALASKNQPMINQPLAGAATQMGRR